MHQYLSNDLFYTKKVKKVPKMYIYMHAYKKYRASPLTDKKNRTVSGGGKKLSGKLKIPPTPPPPPIKNQMVRPLLFIVLAFLCT